LKLIDLHLSCLLEKGSAFCLENSEIGIKFGTMAWNLSLAATEIFISGMMILIEWGM